MIILRSYICKFKLIKNIISQGFTHQLTISEQQPLTDRGLFDLKVFDLLRSLRIFCNDIFEFALKWKQKDWTMTYLFFLDCKFLLFYSFKILPERKIRCAFLQFGKFVFILCNFFQRRFYTAKFRFHNIILKSVSQV